MSNLSKVDKLKKEHQDKLINLYNTYYEKCLGGDTASLSAFLNCSKELFATNDESELIKIIQNTKIDE